MTIVIIFIFLILLIVIINTNCDCNFSQEKFAAGDFMIYNLHNEPTNPPFHQTPGITYANDYPFSVSEFDYNAAKFYPYGNN